MGLFSAGHMGGSVMHQTGAARLRLVTGRGRLGLEMSVFPSDGLDYVFVGGRDKGIGRLER